MLTGIQLHYVQAGLMHIDSHRILYKNPNKQWMVIYESDSNLFEMRGSTQMHKAQHVSLSLNW